MQLRFLTTEYELPSDVPRTTMTHLSVIWVGCGGGGEGPDRNKDASSFAKSVVAGI